MDTADRKKLLLIISNPFAATNVIHSGLIGKLATEYEVYLLSDLIDEKTRMTINRKFNIDMLRSTLQLPQEPIFMKVLRWMEKSLFMNYFNIETHQIKKQGLSSLLQWADVAAYYLTSLRLTSLFLLRFLRKCIIRYQAIYISDPTHIDGVISTSPLDVRENIVVNALNNKNIPSLAIIISWDNLTSKGIINANHDCVLVWNKIMAEDYNRFYPILSHKHAKVLIAGIPRFDIYFQPEAKHEIPSRISDISMTDHVILFATSAFKHFPNQSQIIEHLLEYADKKGDTTILVRCHPGDDVSKYKKYSGVPHLKIMTPVSTSGSSMHHNSIPDLNELGRLATMLKLCSVCVQVASTIRLEAAICNKPVISIAYDGDVWVPDHQSVRRFYLYSHQLELNKLGIDKLVYSKADLFQNLDVLFEQKSQINNHKKLHDFIPYTKPVATQITMEYIRQWLH
jgi:hypothetical protein